MKYERTVRENAPSGKPTRSVGVVWTALDLGLLSKLHGDDRLIPALNDLPEANLEAKGFLPRILGRPKFRVHITILAITRTMNCHHLALCWSGAVARLKDGLDESHGACGLF